MKKKHRVVIGALKLSCVYILVGGDDASRVVLIGLTKVVGMYEIGCVIMPLEMPRMQDRNMLSTLCKCHTMCMFLPDESNSVNEDAAEVQDAVTETATEYIMLVTVPVKWHT